MSGIFGGGSSGGGSTPNPPAFQPIDINSVGNQALQADITGYNLSDANMAQRFPGLVSGRNQQISNAYNQLTGPLDPTVQNSFVNQGMAQSFGAFGGGNNMAGIGTSGTAAGNAVATSLANNVQKKQDYDRQYFEQLLGYNPQRQFGLSGEDVVNMAMANTQGQNAYNQQSYAAKYNNYNAKNAAKGQSSAAALGSTASIIAAVLPLIFSDRRLKEDIKETGAKTKEGIPIKTFKYKGKKGKHVGVIAQDAQRKRPDAVRDVGGVKAVDYAKLILGGSKK